MAQVLKDTLSRGSLGKVAVSSAPFLIAVSLLILNFLLPGQGLAAAEVSTGGQGNAEGNAAVLKTAPNHDDIKLDALEDPREKAPFSLVALSKTGVRVTSISLRDNVTGKIEKVESENFPKAKFFGKLKITGFGKNKVILSDGVKNYALVLEKQKSLTDQKVDKPMSDSGAPAVTATASTNPMTAFAKKVVTYAKSLSPEGMIVLLGVALLVFFLAMVLCVAVYRKIRDLLSPADITETDSAEEDFGDDYEPDAEEQEKIELRHNLKEKYSKAKIVDILVEEGKITPEQAQEALQKERETTRKAELVLADEKSVSKSDAYEARAKKYGMEFVDLARFTEKEENFICKAALGLVPFKLASDAVLFPYRINRRRKILYFFHYSEPTHSLEDDIKRETGYFSKFALAEEEDLKKLIGRMKNYFVLEEKFKLEDIMDPKKKRKIAEKKKSKEIKFTLAKIVFYFFLTLAVAALGLNTFVLNSPRALLSARIDECHGSVIQGDFSKVFDYLDVRSKKVFDPYTLPARFGVSEDEPLIFSRVFEIELDTAKTSAAVKWVATRNKGGTPARSEETSRWIFENGKWCLDLASGMGVRGYK